MKHLFKILIPVLFFITSFTGNTFSGNACYTSSEISQLQFSDSLKADFESSVKQIAVKNKCRMTAKIGNENGDYLYAGYDGRNNTPISDFTGTIDIGSGTKMFTAASIFQLIEQNKLSLQDKLTSVLPNDTLYKGLLVIDGTDYIDSVKIVNLLNHSTGFPEYFTDNDDDEISLHGDSSLSFTPYQLINMAKQNIKKQFIPGTSFKYCNVNYILLGLIIEKLSGMTYHQYVQQNILDKLGLTHTYFASQNYPSDRSAGHFKGNVTEMPATLAGAAGEIISDLDDMQTFIREWYKGNLFKNPVTIISIRNDNFLEMAPSVYYGMGVVNLADLSWGHAGQTFGFQAYMGYLPNGNSFALGIDDASVSAWDEAAKLTLMLTK